MRMALLLYSERVTLDYINLFKSIINCLPFHLFDSLYHCAWFDSFFLQNGRSFHLVKSEGQARPGRARQTQARKKGQRTWLRTWYVAAAMRHAPVAAQIAATVAVAVAVAFASEFK